MAASLSDKKTVPLFPRARKRKQSQSRTYTIRLDSEAPANQSLIAYLDALPRGHLSRWLREAATIKWYLDCGLLVPAGLAPGAPRVLASASSAPASQKAQSDDVSDLLGVLDVYQPGPARKG
jgi:hypothetical protein